MSACPAYPPLSAILGPLQPGFSLKVLLNFSWLPSFSCMLVFREHARLTQPASSPTLKALHFYLLSL